VCVSGADAGTTEKRESERKNKKTMGCMRNRLFSDFVWIVVSHELHRRNDSPQFFFNYLESKHVLSFFSLHWRLQNLI